jgi:hypothetical protein
MCDEGSQSIPFSNSAHDASSRRTGDDIAGLKRHVVSLRLRVDNEVDGEWAMYLRTVPTLAEPPLITVRKKKCETNEWAA